MTRRLRLLAGLLLATVMLTGCDFDVYDLPLPGGTDVGDDPITVTVEFRDVLDLVPKSTVKVNDVSVGRVQDVELTGYTATVTLTLRNDTELPSNTVATIRQTSLLGEKFVSLAGPTDEDPVGTLGDRSVIPLERTGRNPEVEEVLGALSLLLNGGGVAQVKTIAQEVNTALDGREGSARSLLGQVRTLASQLDDNKGDIVTAIESLNRLALSVKKQQGSIDRALEELPSALDSLDRQRDDLVTMLQALDRLSNVGVRVIDRSKDATLESLRQLQPVLTKLADSGDDLVNSFSVILTYPFVDEVVGRDPQVARNIHFGDYTNLSVRLDLDVTDLPDVPGVPCTPLDALPDPLPVDLPNLCQGAQDAIATCVNDPSVATCKGLPGAVIDVVCASVDLPLPVLCPDGTGGGGGGGGDLPLPELPDLPLPDLPLPDLPGGLGGLLGRTAVGAQGATDTEPSAVDGRGPTYGELMESYDPALVNLLIPGMVLR